MPKKKKRDVVMSFSLVLAVLAIGFFAYVIISQQTWNYDKFGSDLSESEKELKQQWEICVDKTIEKGYDLEYSKDVCYLNALGMSVAVEDCEKLLSFNLKEFCYFRIANRDKDISMCSKMISEKRSNCYSSIAKSTGDVSICDKINSGEKIAECKSQFE
tara:strand:- start:61 stop:537 length:477 start_codon:yes stop_codon:yes gene_type:complete